MYGRRYQRKRGFKRAVVALLSLVMLVSVCFPVMRVSAENQADLTVTVGETGFYTAEGLESSTGVSVASPEGSGLAISYSEGIFTVNAVNAFAGTYTVTYAYQDAEGADQNGQFSVAVVPAENPEDELTEEEKAALLQQLKDLLKEAEAAGSKKKTEVYEDILERAADVYEDALCPEEGEIFETFSAIVEQLKKYGYDPYGAVESYKGNGGDQELDASKYNSGSYVFWDTIKASSTSSSGYTSATGGTKPDVTVTLSGLGVTYHNSNGTQNGTSTYTLKSYYPEASAGNMKDATLSITPPDGYYVSKVVIACCSGGTESPHSCRTWNAGNAYDNGFAFTGTGAFSTTVSSLDFSHASRSSRYFILIELTPIPTPLYVEYNYGNVTDFLSADQISGSVFASPSAWTSVTSGNNYGIGGVKTDYTQFEYAYTAGKPTEAANWKHYANTVTAEAKQIAAQNGYYFAGWDAALYTTCTTSDQDDSYGNNYTYTFANEHSTAAYSEGQEVLLKIHTKLTAVWKPITLTITKEVTGLTDRFMGSHEYGVSLYKDGVLVGNEHSLTVAGNSTASETVSHVLPGKYTIQETSGNGNLTLSDGTTLYNSVSYEPAEIEITVESIVAGTTSYNLKVTNTYSDATPMLKFVKVWKDYDGSTLASDSAKLPASISFTVTVDGKPQTVTLTKANGWAATMAMPEGDAISVAEVPVTGFEQQGEIQITTEHDVDNKVVYTVYTATNKLVTTDVTVSKTVSGNMGDTDKGFTFTYKVGENGTEGTFVLKHGQSTVLNNLKIGETLYIKEDTNYVKTVTYTVTDAEGNKTTTTVQESNGWYQIPIVDGVTVSVNNEKNVIIDTGITMDSLPYIFLMALVVLGGGVLLLNKRRMF